MNRLLQYKIDHILFWLITIGFHAYTSFDLIECAGLSQYILEVLIRNGLLAVVIYANGLITLPFLFEKKLIWKGLTVLAATLLFYVALKNAHDLYLGLHMECSVTPTYFQNTYYNFSIVLFYLAFAMGLHLSKAWYLQRETLKKIELEKLNTELEYLKAQINPHFLFNSLNTIFFQIDKSNATARNTLTRFSEMLRYQLYECNDAEIPIEKEIAYLKNYVELQRIRKDEQYAIHFKVDQEAQNFSIPPLLLIPFIENAFKHVSHFTHRKNEIEIKLEKKNDNLHFSVTNTRDQNPNKELHHGIGLKNVKRRLELLFPNRNSLMINEEPDRYTVNLEINLKWPTV